MSHNKREVKKVYSLRRETAKKKNSKKHTNIDLQS